MSKNAQVKFFLGFQQNGEIRLHLNQSALWKDACLFHTQSLIQINFQSKDFIGISVDSPLLYNEIKEKEKDLKQQMQYYCPKLQMDKHHVYLFPQLYLS